MEKSVEKKWEYRGLQLIVTRADLDERERWSMHRCGYVRLPRGHAWHGKNYDDIPADVHGGLTFAEIEPCSHGDGRGYWIGFDCLHYRDRKVPLGHVGGPASLFEDPDGHYWELAEVQAETERLADQALMSRCPHRYVIWQPEREGALCANSECGQFLNIAELEEMARKAGVEYDLATKGDD